MAEFARHDKTEQQLQRLSAALKTGRLQPVRRMINTLPAGEIADLLESLPPEPRALVWELVDPEMDGEILVHVNDEVRSSLIEAMDNEELVLATTDLDLDDLADILDDLPDQVIRQVLHAMDREDRDRLARVLSYAEDTAGGLMDPDVVTVRSNVTIDVVQRYLRVRGELPRPIDDLFVIDRNGRYLGRLRLSVLLTAEPDRMVADLITDAEDGIPVDMVAADVALRFEHHDWVSAPVVDDTNKLLGRITIDDVVDVIREEAEHSVLSMAGLDEEDDMFAPVIASSKRRGLYLGVNLITALVAGWFVGLFDQTLERAVALAVLMPVVASMGGIAGTQTLTLMIRGMAMGQIGSGNTRALLNKEMMVGGLNGMFWAVVVGAVVVLWFNDTVIAAVAAAAILVNLCAGALAGVIVPVMLRRMAIDPALAGGMVLTTVTDVVGFVTLLGLGTLMLL